MPSFRYQYGDRPLEGFTIQHGVGRGGFGEVYFAISDTGREVALKSVQQYEDIELRGIGHCMNLKSPHLISIFDVRHSVNREPFVVMEYVNGPSLRDILDEAPHGLGTVKAVYLLREVAKGLAFLHQNGVVHRDLKPHNVFIEQGLVKIGDYSLSKIMTASHRSGHTVTVGTVHYMAPEIGLGRYDHTVDIYALGVMLYEMLTGVPPFRGDSVGEVLMKHVAGDPELSHIAQPLANVIRKAMNKDPRQRYQSVEQMVADVLACAGVDAGLASVSVDDLSMIANRELRSASAPLKKELPPNYSNKQDFVAFPPANVQDRPVQNAKHGFFHHVNLGLSQLCSAIGLSRTGWPDYWGPVKDPVDIIRRGLLACLAIAFFVMVPTVLFRSDNVFATLIVLIGGGSFVLMIAKWLLLPALESNASTVYRLLFGIVGSAFMIVSSMMIAETMRRNGDLVVAIGCCCCFPLWLIDWRVMSSPIRPQRLSFTPVIGVAVLAVFPPAMWVIAGIAVAVQLGSKYDPALSQRFGVNFPWLQHFLAALKSLAKPRPRVVPNALQYARSTAAPVSMDQVVPNREPVSQDWQSHETDIKSQEWQLPGKVAVTLYKIPVNQYSAVVADSLVKAGGSFTRFVFSAVCVATIGAAWLILLGTFVGVPQLIQHTAPSRELADVEYFFGPGDWTVIVIRLARVTALLFAVPAIAVLLRLRMKKSRERVGQTVLAISLLGVSLLVLGQSFQYGDVWNSFGSFVRGGENGYAMSRLLDEISLMGILLGLLIAMAGLFFLLVGFRAKASTNEPTNAPIHSTSDVTRTNDNSAGSSVQAANLEIPESNVENKPTPALVS